MWGDAGYIGVQKRGENLGLEANWQAAMKPGQGASWLRTVPKHKGEMVKVEHPFLDVKQIFGNAKVRYRGLDMNTNRLALLLGLSILRRAKALPAT